MGGGGGSTGSQTAAPWDWQAPHIIQQFQRARDLPRQRPHKFIGTAPFSGPQEQALAMMQERALAGSPLLPAAQAQQLGTIQGDYLYGGQGFNQALDAARRAIVPQVQGQFERAGRFGGGLAQEAETRAIADAFAGLYDQERARQMTATSMAPAMAMADYADMDRLAQVGDVFQAQRQRELDERMRKWYFRQQSPYTKLAAVNPIVMSGWQPGFQEMKDVGEAISPGAGAAGGAATGAAMGSMIMPGWGTAIGALLGAGAGYYGATQS